MDEIEKILQANNLLEVKKYIDRIEVNSKIDYFSEEYPNSFKNEELRNQMKMFGIIFFLSIAINPYSELYNSSRFVKNILSQDESTKYIGYDIDEYKDYFKNIDSIHERLAFAESIYKNWNLT